MKTLPDNPNLEHLRRQAKTLLREIRLTEPAATLHDAQTALASQYGYRSWPELKTEVDRRRASVEVADPDLAGAVAAAFGLGTVAAPMTSVERGAMGHIWRLETDRGEWAAKQLFPWAGSSNAEVEARLVEAAVAAGIRTPAIVRSADGAVVVRIGDADWRVFEWMKLGPGATRPAPVGIAAALGDVLGRLHALRLPAPGPVTPWLTSRPAASRWTGLLEQARAAGASWAPLLDRAIPQLEALADFGLPADGDIASAILCHCDLSLGNVRADKAGVVLLDFEHAGSSPPRWELGGVLHQWTIGPADHVNEAAVAALVDAYRAAGGVPGPLGPEIFASAIAGSMNWLATRLAKALDDSNPAEQERSRRQLPELLAGSLSRGSFERVLAAVDATKRRRVTA